MKGYYITHVLDFPLWDDRGRKMNRHAVETMVEDIVTGKKLLDVDFDRVELVKSEGDKHIQFVYWKKEGS